MLAARHDVIAVVPEDPAERELPDGPGYIQVRDVESGRQAAVSLSDRVHAGLYAAEAQRGATRWSARSTRCRCEHVFVPTDESPVEPLLSFFARNVGR